MSSWRGEPERKWRRVHYGRGVNEGQRNHMEEARHEWDPREVRKGWRSEASAWVRREALMAVTGAVGRWWRGAAACPGRSACIG